MSDILFHQNGLFWFVTSCGLIGAFIPFMVKMVLQILTRETEMEVNLRRQVCDLKAELGSINMVDEFPKYAKIQRKVNKVTEELANQSRSRTSYSMKIRLIVTATLYGIMFVIVCSLVWQFKNYPLAKLPEQWFYPFSPLIAYPTDVSGGIGLTTWLLVTGTVGRIFANCLT